MSDTDILGSYARMVALRFHDDTIEDNYVFEGRLFESFVTQSMASGATFDIAIATGSKPMTYMPSTVTTTADSVTIGLYEGSVASGGTTLASYNHNRISSVTSETTLKTAPTVTSLGSLFSQSYIGGSTGVGQTKVGGSSSGSYKYVLKPNTQYILRFTNGSSATNVIHVKLGWLESV